MSELDPQLQQEPQEWWLGRGAVHGSTPAAAPHSGPAIGTGKFTPEVITPIRKTLNLAPDEPAGRRKSKRDPQPVWAALPRQVMGSCSVALRRMGDGQLTSLAVTSAGRGEGRTTLSVGLAAAAVVEHRRTAILLDLDVERGSVGSRLSLPPGPSLLDVLEGTATVDDCLVSVDERVQVLPAGPKRDAISLIAQQDRLENLLKDLDTRCDILIADLPPLSAGITTSHLADLFSAVALVVRAGVTPLPRVEQLSSTLAQAPFVMLNRTEARHRSLIRRLMATS